MGFRRNKYFGIIFLFIFFNISILAFDVIVEAQPKDSIAEKIVETFITSVPGILIAYLGIIDNKKRDKKAIEIQWYNDIVLDKIIPVINDYFDFLTDNLQKLNESDVETESKAKLFRNKTQGIIKLLTIFDKDDNIQRKITIHLSNTQDIYRELPMNSIKILTKISNERKIIIKTLFDLKENLKI